jgi:hypothetical protein
LAAKVNVSALSQNYTFKTMAGNAGYGADDGIDGRTQFGAFGPIAVDDSGNICGADSSNYTIRKLTPVGTNGQVTTIAGLPGICGSIDGTNDGARFYTPEGAPQPRRHLF